MSLGDNGRNEICLEPFNESEIITVLTILSEGLLVEYEISLEVSQF